MSKQKQKRAKRLGFLGKLKVKGDSSGRRRNTEADPRKAEDVRKRRLQDLQQKQKMSRERELMKRRNLQSFQDDVLQRQKQFEQKEAEMIGLEKHVNLENENSRKAYYREFKKVVEASDVVLEVLDARDPLGCRCPQVEQAVIQSGTNKKIVLVLNKIDLVPKDVVEKWIKYLRSEFPTVAFKSSTQQQTRNLKRSNVPVTRASGELLGSSACLGADCLMKLLGNYSRNRDIRTAITVGVVGFPNVGKSSLINSLKRARACSVGATPGVTRCLQEVHLDKHVKLLDCPGIVMATTTSDAAMILRNCVKIEALLDPLPPVEAILRRCSKAQIMEHYGVAEFQTSLQFLALLARRQGKLRRGGLPDTDKAAKSVLMDWTGGRISYFTHPPETHTLPTHISAEIVAKMADAFDWEELERGTRDVLADSSCPDVQMGFCMEPAGIPHGGPEDEAELMEDGRDPEFGPLTVEMKSQKTPKQLAGDVGPRAPDLEDIFNIDPLQQGHALLAAKKKRRRQQKRADTIATRLSASLAAAMDFSFSD